MISLKMHCNKFCDAMFSCNVLGTSPDAIAWRYRAASRIQGTAARCQLHARWSPGLSQVVVECGRLLVDTVAPSVPFTLL